MEMLFLLDVQRDQDIRTRWLAAQREFINLEEVNRVKADFRYIFPSE